MISAKRVLLGLQLRRAVLSFALSTLSLLCLPAMAGAATPGPAWEISSSVYSPTNFIRGDSTGQGTYFIKATNIGSKATSGIVTITDYLPPGLTANEFPETAVTLVAIDDDPGLLNIYPCAVGAFVRCTFDTVVHPGERLIVILPVNVAPDASATVTNQATVTGGGAPGASTSVQTSVSSEVPPFDFQSLSNSFLDVGGAAEIRAGSHPYQWRLAIQFNTIPSKGFGLDLPAVENLKDVVTDLPAGFFLNPHATPARCTEAELEVHKCPNDSIVGSAYPTVGLFGFARDANAASVYNMVPPPGSPAVLAFDALGTGTFVHLLGRLRSDGDYGLTADTANIVQFAGASGITVNLWGNPSDPSHDFRRCSFNSPYIEFNKACSVSPHDTALLTMPTACSGPLVTTIRANSWQNPGKFVSASARTEDAAGNPVGVTGCDKLSYAPSTEPKTSTERAGTGTGLDFNVRFQTNGLDSFDALAESVTTKGVTMLPEGMTINPSVGEGLGFCTPAQYGRETVNSIDGEGCPVDSKLGTLHLTTPLVDEALDGSVYLAQQDDPATPAPGVENPFDTDIALYLVLRNSDLGVLAKRPLKLTADPLTGQLTAFVDEVPQLPFSHFNFHFKEGARAALITPPACGKYTTVTKLYPSSDPTHPKTVNSDFEINKGVNGGPCPAGGVPPFQPDFHAGAVNNNAGAFSPFNMRLMRHDGEQDMTKFSAVLPPGELGSLAGVSKCSNAAIVLAKAKTGRQEKASPSCPANSLIGHTLAGAGVGESLTYVPGNLYLGGPYRGDPLSVISITAALAGPLDAGTVVTQLALTLNPKTAEVEVDGKSSDPIPHILKGIVLKMRDLRVYVDRPNFTLNPTSCSPSSVKGTLFGSYLSIVDPADDVPADLSTRYQAADCQSLGYKPRLSLQMRGGTKRGGHPGLLATYRTRPGDANSKGITVRLPRSAFLDQAHIRTICTRAQFATDSCPPAARYGYIKAWTPLLDETLQGPVWLRSSNHKLPDLVFDLHGLVDIEVATRIDSVNGGIRASIKSVPDAPLSKVKLRMQGGKKGLIINSRNLCGAISRAGVELEAQNGKVSTSHPVMKADCRGKHKRRRR